MFKWKISLNRIFLAVTRIGLRKKYTIYLFNWLNEIFFFRQNEINSPLFIKNFEFPSNSNSNDYSLFPVKISSVQSSIRLNWTDTTASLNVFNWNSNPKTLIFTLSLYYRGAWYFNSKKSHFNGTLCIEWIEWDFMWNAMARTSRRRVQMKTEDWTLFIQERSEWL